MQRSEGGRRVQEKDARQRQHRAGSGQRSHEPAEAQALAEQRLAHRDGHSGLCGVDHRHARGQRPCLKCALDQEQPADAHRHERIGLPGSENGRGAFVEPVDGCGEEYGLAAHDQSAGEGDQGPSPVR